MVSEEYLSHLKDRVRREVISRFFSFAGRRPAPLEHPLPPPLREDLRKSRYDRYRAKRSVLDAIDFIIRNKRAVEERDAKELSDFRVIVGILPSPDLEDRFIAELQRMVDELRKDRLKLLDHSRASRSLPIPHPLDPELVRIVDPVTVMVLPRLVKDVMHRHGLHRDEEIRNKLQELQNALRTPPPHLAPEWWLLQAELKFSGYLDLLERTSKMRRK